MWAERRFAAGKHGRDGRADLFPGCRVYRVAAQPGQGREHRRLDASRGSSAETDGLAELAADIRDDLRAIDDEVCPDPDIKPDFPRLKPPFDAKFSPRCHGRRGIFV